MEEIMDAIAKDDAIRKEAIMREHPQWVQPTFFRSLSSSPNSVAVLIELGVDVNLREFDMDSPPRACSCGRES